MTNIKNISPIGDLDVPLLGGIVKAGETVDVAPEHAERLLRQVDVWQLADTDPSQRPADSAAKADWLAHATHLGIEAAAKMTKPELIEATKPAVVEEYPGGPVVTIGEDGLPILSGPADADQSGDTNDTNDAALAAEEQGE